MFLSRRNPSNRPRHSTSASRLRRPYLEVVEPRIAPAAIVGHVFIDANGNAVRDNNEPGQAGVIVFIDLNGDGKLTPGNTPGTPGEPHTQTNQEGKYTLQAGPGTYHIRQIVPQNFTQTTPTPPAVIVGNQVVVDGPDFGNKQQSPPPVEGGTIHGVVFIDADGDGTQGSMEGGQGNVRVFIDLNGDGKWSNVPGPITLMEPSDLSAPDGKYQIKIFADGDYQLLEVVPQGYKMTTPIPGKTMVAGGAVVQGPSFGNMLQQPPPVNGGTIHGVVFIDENGNGMRENTEPGQPGVRVFIDLNNNGKFDPANTGTIGDPSTISGQEGKYQLKIGIDGDFQVLEVVPQGFKMTTPMPGKTAVAGGAVVAGPDFGNMAEPPPPVQGGIIRGRVFVDLNGNGTRENNEPGQSGVIVFIDANGNGMFDPGTTPTQGEQFTISGKEGRYDLKVNKNGEYWVLEVVPQGFKMTTPPPAPVTVSNGSLVPGPLFGNQPLITDKLGAVSGRVFYDSNNNGKLDPFEPGLPNIRIYDDANNNGKFNIGERSVLSNFNGNYLLRLTPGKHHVREVIPSGFVLTTAPGVVTIVAGQVVQNAHFGNRFVGGGGGGGPGVPIWGGFTSDDIVEDTWLSPVFNGAFVGMP